MHIQQSSFLWQGYQSDKSYLLACCICTCPFPLQGTVAYMAPEVLHSPTGHYDGKTADLWSCGVVLYTMLVGGMPFRSINNENLGKTVLKLLDDMRAARYAFPSHLGAAARDLVARLLCPEPQKRITIAEVLHHPWFTPGLPSSALSMNDAYLKLERASAQSEDEIKAIVMRAVLDGEQMDGSSSCSTRAYAGASAKAAGGSLALAKVSPEQPLRVL
jgi:serine/threonine-protein kinase SRK2